MNYIVFDLEWNQSPRGSAGEHPRMPFEIIEIGAVKLDESFEILDEFHTLITPHIYPKLHRVIRGMLNYDEKVLKKEGIGFKEACRAFLTWCGEDYQFCTWGSSDLYFLQNNMDFYYMERLPYPVRYYNVQQIYADIHTENHEICKLEKAVEHLGLAEQEAYHSAISDARYTARVMKAGIPSLGDHYVYDIYRHPKTREEEIHDLHGGVLDEISSEYASRKAAVEDKNTTLIYCIKCGKPCRDRVSWFQTGGNSLTAAGKCFLHGYMVSQYKVKNAGNSTDNVFLMKRTYAADRADIRRLREKREQVMARKKIKKRQEYEKKAR